MTPLKFYNIKSVTTRQFEGFFSVLWHGISLELPGQARMLLKLETLEARITKLEFLSSIPTQGK